MSFAARIRRAPRPFETARGREVAALYPDAPGELRDLIAGTAGCSPFLSRLLERERDWLTEALSLHPDEVRAGFLDLPEGDAGAALRQAKRRLSLYTALADLGGVWSLEEVTGCLTDFADLAVETAMRAELAREVRRGKLAMAEGDDPARAAGMVVIAMGKMGAGELNYSSDIDLVCLFDQSRHDGDRFHEVRSVLVRATRHFSQLLSEVTGDGYVFRTDLRLRPDPSVTPVCLSMEAAERYYESVGRAWERAAHIKARAAAGDISAGEAYLERLSPFVWRRHLDYAAIRDAHDIRLKIRDHKGGSDALEGRDIKLGRGGIREIEFFTQTRQLIAGGRDPDLRARGTVAALRSLEAKGWAGETDALIADYRAHRELEHRLQMIEDRQTQSLPSGAAGFDRLAAFMDRDTGDLRAEIGDRLSRVARIAEGFFDPGAARPAPEVPDALRDIVARWPSYPALRSARAAEIFDRVRPEILSRLDRAARPEEALTHIDAFLKGLPAGVQVFALFDANPQLIDLVVDIAATSPALARYLSRHAGVLDAVIGGGFFADWPGAEGLARDLAGHLSRETDYEARLLAARHWRNEWHFRIGVHHLRGLIDAGEAGAQYADLAEAVLSGLGPAVVADFATRHGPPPGRGAALVGMGSLGARRLSATSDLDLIAIYDAGDVVASDGPRALTPSVYYARLTQAFVTALTAPMGPGRLYEVDMRLRPSGRQGPVATSLAAFRAYQKDEAWTWEHLALTSARVVVGPEALAEEIGAFREDLIAGRAGGADILRDTARMRGRLARAAGPADSWDVKAGPGRLRDIALLAEAGALLAGAPDRGTAAQLAAGQGALGLSDSEVEALGRADAALWSVQAAARLMAEGPFDPAAVGAGGREFLLRGSGFDAIDALGDGIARLSDRAAAIIDAHLPAATGEAEDDDR